MTVYRDPKPREFQAQGELFLPGPNFSTNIVLKYFFSTNTFLKSNFLLNSLIYTNSCSPVIIWAQWSCQNKFRSQVLKSSNLGIDLWNSFSPGQIPKPRTTNSRTRPNLEIPGPGQILFPVVYCFQKSSSSSKNHKLSVTLPNSSRNWSHKYASTFSDVSLSLKTCVPFNRADKLTHFLEPGPRLSWKMRKWKQIIFQHCGIWQNESG